MKFKPVTRYTRAGHAGKVLKCPKCDATQKVFSFSWGALGCPSCNAMLNKYQWLVRADDARSKLAKPTPVEALITGSVVVIASRQDDTWRSLYYMSEDERVLVTLGEGLVQTGRDLIPLGEGINAVKGYEDHPDRWKITIRG